MEHNSNYVPWYALCREILPRSACGSSAAWPGSTMTPANSTWTTSARWSTTARSWSRAPGRPTSSGRSRRWRRFGPIADASGYVQPLGGVTGSLLLVDGPSSYPPPPIDVQALDADYLAFSFHKLFAPFGVGVLYAKEALRAVVPPVPLRRRHDRRRARSRHDAVGYNELPWSVLHANLSADATQARLSPVLGPVSRVRQRRPRASSHHDGRSQPRAPTRTRQAGVPDCTVYNPDPASTIG